VAKPSEKTAIVARLAKLPAPVLNKLGKEFPDQWQTVKLHQLEQANLPLKQYKQELVKINATHKELKTKSKAPKTPTI
jgi:hypothetical protein